MDLQKGSTPSVITSAGYLTPIVLRVFTFSFLAGDILDLCATAGLFQQSEHQR